MKNKQTYLVVTTLLTAILLGAVSFGQETYDFDVVLSPREFVIDYAYFKSDNDLAKLELYYRLYNSNLQFVSSGDHYQAEYEIAVLIRDKGGRQVTASTKDRSVSIYDYEATISANDYRISQLDYYVPPGKYKVDVVLTDKNSGNQMKGRAEVEIPKFDSKYPQFSSVEFLHSVDTSIVDSVFLKGNISAIPAADRRFSGDTSASLLYYFELYQGKDRHKEVRIETRITDKNFNHVYSDTITVNFPDGVQTIRQVRQVSLKYIRSGNYSLEMVVKGDRNRDRNKIKSNFFLYWPPDKMILHDPDLAVSMLKYIAGPGEMKDMRNADTPEKRLDLFTEFWKEKDPTPATKANEAKTNYYNRIEFANRAFSILKKDGWRTDFGMVYIQYGKPDQIEDYPFELSTKAYQIWHYYRLKEPRKFVFVDEWGDGDYRLQYPYDGRSW